jgi:hypothetical protein
MIEAPCGMALYDHVKLAEHGEDCWFCNAWLKGFQAAKQESTQEELPPVEKMLEWRGTLKDIACFHDECELIDKFFNRYIPQDER